MVAVKATMFGATANCPVCGEDKLRYQSDFDSFVCLNCERVVTAEFMTFYKGKEKKMELKTHLDNNKCIACGANKLYFSNYHQLYVCNQCDCKQTLDAMENFPPPNKELVEENRRLTNDRGHYRDMLHKACTMLGLGTGTSEDPYKPGEFISKIQLMRKNLKELETVPHEQGSKPLGQKQSYFYPRAQNPGQLKTKHRIEIRCDDMSEV